jgi:hypothetical protein
MMLENDEPITPQNICELDMFWVGPFRVFIDDSDGHCFSVKVTVGDFITRTQTLGYGRTPNEVRCWVAALLNSLMAAWQQDVSEFLQGYGKHATFGRPLVVALPDITDDDGWIGD